LNLVESIIVSGQLAGTVPFTVTLPVGATQTSFLVRRTAPGPLMARMTVTDTCGAWPTFVGAGPDAGW
jgi:hypothetical protein